MRWPAFGDAAGRCNAGFLAGLSWLVSSSFSSFSSDCWFSTAAAGRFREDLDLGVFFTFGVAFGLAASFDFAAALPFALAFAGAGFKPFTSCRLGTSN